MPYDHEAARALEAAEHTNWRVEQTPVGPMVVSDFAPADGPPYAQGRLVATANALLPYEFNDAGGVLAHCVADGEGSVRYLWVLLGTFDVGTSIDAPSESDYAVVPLNLRHLLAVE